MAHVKEMVGGFVDKTKGLHYVNTLREHNQKDNLLLNGFPSDFVIVDWRRRYCMKMYSIQVL